MFEWIGDNSSALNVFLNLGILLVWVTYLHLLLMAYVRQRRASIIVNRGAGHGVEARCLLSNMSAEPIYIQNLVATLKNDSGEWKAVVTDLEEAAAQGSELKHVTSQGPLDSGEFFDAGTFSSLARRAARLAGAPSEDLERDYACLELTVVAAYGTDSMFVAARREFRLEDEGRLVPATTTTVQIRSRAERRKIDRFLRDHM